MSATTSMLLADPAQVALIRALITYARQHHAEHAAYSFGNGLGQPMGPREHTWTLGERRVSYQDGELRFLSSGVPLLKVHTVDVRQAAQLLAAIGVLPQRFIGTTPADEPTRPIRPARRCRHCGATSGLVMLPHGPLDPPQWECTNGCNNEQPGR